MVHLARNTFQLLPGLGGFDETDIGPGAALTEEAVRDFCHGKIAHYKVPRYVVFVDEYPTTVTGKVQKFKLRELGIERFGLQKAAAVETA